MLMSALYTGAVVLGVLMVVVVVVVVVALRLPCGASPRFTGCAAGRLQGYYG